MDEADFAEVRGTQVEWVTDATVFATAPVGHLWRWWRDESAAGVPPKARFDILDHARHASRLYLVERVGDDFLFRVRGDHVLELLGRKTTLRNVGAYEAREADLMRSYYGEILSRGTCCKCTGTLRYFGKDHVGFESIDCPLADADGHPRFIIGALDVI